MLIGASFDGISLLVAGTMSFINRRMGLTGSSRSTVQNNPSRTSPRDRKSQRAPEAWPIPRKNIRSLSIFRPLARRV